MPLERLIYVSRVDNAVRLEDAEGIAERSARRNAQDALTGFLLYTPEYFVQVLEGDPDAVQATFERIARDDRHSEVRVLGKERIEQRAFSDWSMGFAFMKRVFAADRDQPPEDWDLGQLLERLTQLAADPGR